MKFKKMFFSCRKATKKGTKNRADKNAAFVGLISYTHFFKKLIFRYFIIMQIDEIGQIVLTNSKICGKLYSCIRR